MLGQISVAGAGIGTGAGFTAGGLLRRQTIEALRTVPGVAAVQAQVMLPLNPSTSQLFSLNQELVLGVDLAVPSPNRNYPTFPIAQGRSLMPADHGRVVVGAELAVGRALHVGSRLRIGERDFEVVGVGGRGGSPRPMVSPGSLSWLRASFGPPSTRPCARYSWLEAW